MKLLEELESLSGRKLKLRINDNRSTMLSVRWFPSEVRISVHKMFLEAPKEVTEALGAYLKIGKNTGLPVEVKNYIRYGGNPDNRHKVQKAALVTKGEYFDLEELYHHVNRSCFNSSLNLAITWYGESGRRFRSSVVFGHYIDSLKLVKIHRILDRPDVPRYVIEFIVFHEMLHSVCLPRAGKRGRGSIHTPEFRAREKEHRYFELAERWIKQNKHKFFY